MSLAIARTAVLALSLGLVSSASPALECPLPSDPKTGRRIDPALDLPSHSPCPAAGPFRFVVSGDPHLPGAMSLQAQLTSRICALEPHFVFYVGDLASNGGPGEWRQFLDVTAPLGDRRYVVPGNHDIHPALQATGTLRKWRETFGASLDWVESLPPRQLGPALSIDADRDGVCDENEAGGSDCDALDRRRGTDYWFACGNSRMLSISTDSPYHESGPPDNLGWFRDTLNAFKDPDPDDDPSTPEVEVPEHVFVFTHHPFLYDLDANTRGSQGLWRQLADPVVVSGPNGTTLRPSNVRALFAGHFHLYQPSGTPDPTSAVKEIVVGTGGANFHFGGAYPEQARHGFLVVDVDGPSVQATFYGDRDNVAPDGNYEIEPLDSFGVWEEGFELAAPQPARLAAEYRFEPLSGCTADAGRCDSAQQPCAGGGDGAGPAAAACRQGPAARPEQAGSRAQRGALEPNHLGWVGGAALEQVEGERGTVLRLDGKSAARSISPSDHALTLNRGVTLSLWAKCDPTGCGAEGSEGTLLSHGGELPGYPPLESDNRVYELRIGDDGRLRFTWEFRPADASTNHAEIHCGAEAGCVSRDAVAQPGAWHHYQVVRDPGPPGGRPELRFYVDFLPLGEGPGVSWAGDPTGQAWQALPSGGHQGSLVLGSSVLHHVARLAAGGDADVPGAYSAVAQVTQGFKGWLDDVRVLSSAALPLSVAPDAGTCPEPARLRLDASGFVPGAELVLYSGAHFDRFTLPPGEAACSTASGGAGPRCGCAGTSIGLRADSSLRSQRLRQRADASGRVRELVDAPGPGACGRLYQLLDTRSCAVTNVSGVRPAAQGR